MNANIRTPWLGIAFTFLLLVPASAPAADNYTIDSEHSSIIFKSLHFGTGHIYGRFNQFSGKFSVDAVKPSKSSVELEVKSASVDTGNAKRDQHIKSPDFLNARQFPVISFKSTSAKKKDDHTAELVGDLTLHGITRSVKAQVRRIGSGKDPWGNQRLGVETSFTIKRSDFGIKFMPEGVGDLIQVTLAAEGILQNKANKHARAD